MSGSDFSLTSHEVMRGIKVRDGQLRLRPSGLVLLGSALDAILGGAGAVFAVLAGGWWIVVAVPAAIAAADAMQRTRVAVIAGSESIVVRNRWRRRRITVTESVVATVESVEWLFRQPVYTFVGWWPDREWAIGVIRSSDGRRVQCDALISAPGDDAADPTPTEAKIGALNRWIAAHL